MKRTTYSIDPQTGAVAPVSALSRGLSACEVEASTKTEATALALAAYARNCAAGGPKLIVRNGAYCLAIPTAAGWVTECGTTHPRNAMQTGLREQFPLCSGGTYASAADAVKASGVEHYGTAEFQAEERERFGASGTVEADTLATLRSVMEWTGREAEATPLERREMLIRNAVRVMLAKVDRNWLAAHDAKDSAAPALSAVPAHG